MNYLVTLPLDGRALRRIITQLLKKGSATSIHRLNYAKKYRLDQGGIQKQEEKILLITAPEEKRKEIEAVLQKICNDSSIQLLPLSTD